MTVYEFVVTALLCACAAHCVLLDAASILVLLRKARLYALGLLAMAVGRDKRWRSRRVDARTVRAARLVDTKRLVFVRHGESEWNRIFNVGPKALAPFKLAIALVREAALLLRGDPGSVFLDAPLTTLGLEQAQAVAAVLRGPPAGPAAALELATLRGDATAPRTSVVVSSNLRRAAQTAALAFQHRLRGGEAVRVLSCLQEISNNVDAVALAPPGAAPDLPRVPAPLRGPGAFDGAGNLGTKPPRGDGRRRLEAFCAYALAADEGCVVAVGHSPWFPSFFDDVSRATRPTSRASRRSATAASSPATSSRGSCRAACPSSRSRRRPSRRSRAASGARRPRGRSSACPRRGPSSSRPSGPRGPATRRRRRAAPSSRCDEDYS